MLGLGLNITIHKMIQLPYLLFFFYVHNVIFLLIIGMRILRTDIHIAKGVSDNHSHISACCLE